MFVVLESPAQTFSSTSYLVVIRVALFPPGKQIITLLTVYTDLRGLIWKDIDTWSFSIKQQQLNYFRQGVFIARKIRTSQNLPRFLVQLCQLVGKRFLLCHRRMACGTIEPDVFYLVLYLTIHFSVFHVSEFISKGCKYKKETVSKTCTACAALF